MSLLPRLEINPDDPPVATVIWLHGLGADGHDFAPIVSQLNVADKPIRFVFPHAPAMPVTLNAGLHMPAWFDILGLGIDAPVDKVGVHQMEQRIQDLIENECQQKIESNNIILAGFSQGGAMALFTALRYPQRLAGVIALSTFLPLEQELVNFLSEANHDLPIFMGHGERDPLVDISWGQHCADKLVELGYRVDWHTYPIEHTVYPQEIAAIAQWLEQIIS